MTLQPARITITPSTKTSSVDPSISSWVEINSDALAHNIRQYRTIIKNALYAPVIKSNAYGHGMQAIASLCDHNPDVDWLCVVSVQEALTLRTHGIQKPLLVLSILNSDIDAAIAHNIDLVLYDWHTALQLSACAQRTGHTAYVHIKIDTGLSRLGILWHEAAHFVHAVHKLPGIGIRGIFTHFSDSESDDPTFCNLQMTRFNELTEYIHQQGITIPLQHMSCSAAASGHPASHGTLVRAGIGMYGLWPSAKNKEKTLSLYPSFSLRPVMTWKTRILQIKTVPAGSFIGYDRTHVTQRQTTIATLPVGYWDGYDRALSNNSFVQLQGICAPQVGRIAMNLMMIDITGINAHPGDEVTLLGNDSGITADDLAQRINTINYEIVTRINPTISRVLV